jgi:hypothetical protein
MTELSVHASKMIIAYFAKHLWSEVGRSNSSSSLGPDSAVAWPAGGWPRTIRVSPNPDDSLRSGAAGAGRIDRRIRGVSLGLAAR